MPNGLFDSTIGLLGNALDLRAARHKLITSNVANIETPGYRATDIRFEDELKKRSEGFSGPILVRTSPMHMDPSFGVNGEPRPVDAATDIESYDRNSVGVEAEMAKLSENTLMYTASEKMLKAKFNILMTAIKEGSR